MNNILQWIIDLPFVVFPVMEEVYQVFTSPINEVLHNFLDFIQGLGLTILSPLVALIEGLLNFLTAIGTDISLIDLLIGGLLPIIILITLVKWVIGIFT